MRALILNRGRFAVVDDEVWHRVRDRKWHAWTTDGRKWHAKASRRTDGEMYLHRLIMSPPKGMVVRHLNNNGLDCRKSNMVVCTRSEALRQTPTGGAKSPDSILHHAGNAHARVSDRGEVGERITKFVS